MKRVITIAFWLSLLMWQCSPHYIHSNFGEITRSHEVIAILPVEVIFTGKAPENLNPEDIAAIEEAEALSFQISLYNDILRSTKNGRKPIWINLQAVTRTNNVLSNADLTIPDTWQEDPTFLADILEVDAVLKTRIEKMRYMSDFESFGIDLGIHIVNAITSHPFWWIPHDLAKSKEIRASYQLIDRKSGTTLWSFADEMAADWSRSSEEIIREVTRRAGRKFPYRY